MMATYEQKLYYHNQTDAEQAQQTLSQDAFIWPEAEQGCEFSVNFGTHEKLQYAQKKEIYESTELQAAVWNVEQEGRQA